MNTSEKQTLTSNLDNYNTPAENLIDLLQLRAQTHPEKTCYIFLEDGITEKDTMTFKEMEKRARAIACNLQKKGKKGDRVIMLFNTGIEFIVSLFGVFYAGMIGVPMYPPRRNKANERFHLILENTNTDLIICTSDIQADIQKNFKEDARFSNLDFSVYEEINNTECENWVKPEIEPDDIAILQYTSGSTGKPNGVMVTHANVLHNCKVIYDGFGFSENTVGINWTPNFHDMGLIGALLQVPFAGCSNVIIPPIEFLKNPLNWLKTINKYKGTTAGGPNFAYDHCIQRIPDEERDDLDVRSITTFYCGAEPIRKSTLQNFAKEFKPSKFKIDQFYPCYGLAESTLMVTGGDFQKEPVFFSASAKALETSKVVPASSGEDSRDFVGCGYPWHGTTVIIANPENMTTAPSGEIGEIWVSGPSVAKGYWNNPEETERTFNAFLKDTGEGPFLRTGDMGFIREDELFVSGRLKDLIIIRGTNHYPQDIELTIEGSHQALKKNAGACFSIDLADEERLVLVNEVERTFMRELSAEEVFDAIRMKLAEDHSILPYAIILIRPGSIPKTSSGKIQRQACKKAYLLGELSILEEWKMNLDDKHDSQLASLDKDSLRQWLINWLCAQKDLDPASIDPDKPITAYGLDSLLAVNLEKEVNENFGISWPIESFLQENTINQLVEEGERLLKEKS